MQVVDLVKQYPGVRAVDGISFTVPAGSCFGLLGPNGAGKTTTVEIMEGILQPTAGQVTYRGRPLGAEFREVAGVQFQNTALQDFLTVEENLRFFRRLYRRGLSVDELCDLCSLQGFRRQDANSLSGGQRQRLLLAIAMVNDPEILFLDEPTTGLDPQARRNFWQLVEGVRAQGKTIVLTTHYMEEAHRLCDEIVIVDHGRIIAQGSPRTLLSEHFGDAVIELPAADYPDGLISSRWKVLPCGDQVEILTDDADATLRWLIEEDVSLARMTLRARTLEDLFLALTGEALRT